ncbi:MAG: MCE family protein [Gemmatimonadetes bacterium]|nr:MCE family protein [Gemmatimonadota bacterium]
MASYDRGRDAARVGGLMALAVVVFSALFLWLTDRGFARHRADLYVRLPSAERLKKGDPVLLRGVPVGDVRGLAFAPDGGVVVRTRLKRRLTLGNDATASLVAVDVFGAQSVVLREGSPAAHQVQDGDTLPGAATPSLAARAEALGAGAERLLGDTTVTLVHGSLAGVARAALELHDLLAGANTLLGTQSASLAAATANLAQLSRNLEGATHGPELAATVANLQATTANLAAMTANLETASATFGRVLARLETGQGTAGRLLHDPALYERAFAATSSLDALLRDVRENPKRYINVSVF